MKITLVGMGSGAPGSLTAAGLETLRGAELIIGARRLLENLPEGCTANRAALYKTDEICALLWQTDCAEAAVVFSGDTGFYSGAAALCRALDDAGLPYTVLPGVSSVQLLAAALGRPWQGWRLVSAHGCACDPVAACRAGGTTFFLTGGSETPATLCQQLAAAGLGDAAATVGENLGTPSQRLVTGTAQELAAQHFAPLSVLLVENVPAPLRRTPGLPDAAFIRGKTPMTKQEVRAAALAKLAVRPTDTLWAISCGTWARAPAASAWRWRWPPLRAGSAPWSATRKPVTLSVRTAQNLRCKICTLPRALPPPHWQAGPLRTLFLSAAARAVCGLSSMPRWPRTPMHGSVSAPLRWKPYRRPLRP